MAENDLAEKDTHMYVIGTRGIDFMILDFDRNFSDKFSCMNFRPNFRYTNTKCS
jgi:hypothetical protein